MASGECIYILRCCGLVCTTKFCRVLSSVRRPLLQSVVLQLQLLGIGDYGGGQKNNVTTANMSGVVSVAISMPASMLYYYLLPLKSIKADKHNSLRFNNNVHDKSMNNLVRSVQFLSMSLAVREVTLIKLISNIQSSNHHQCVVEQREVHMYKK